MFRQEKEQMLGILDSMMELHKIIATAEVGETRNGFLGDCQAAAISIGTALEQEQENWPTLYGNCIEIVTKLEEYCEKVWQISGIQEDVLEKVVALDCLLEEVKRGVYALQLRRKIVFLPYKVEMWDAMESIYLAAKDDIRCDTVVCPIPYFELDAVKQEWIPTYDGGRFSKDIPVTHFSLYSLESECPDVAYIHNPYDDGNLVTTVHPNYYSWELKKQVRELVYIPYYVTTGFMSPEHMMLSVYQYMDYAILQSAYMKETCQGLPYYDRILPFGSPKLDKVIRKCKEGVKLPDEWKKVIGNKRILMLNTSIGDLLQGNQDVIMKLNYFFDLIKEKENLVVIWRPHPLLKSTIRALRPELLISYEKLEKRFVEEELGVLDQTPDIADTIAIADGYVGSGGSSVINLFGATGKPIFVFNNFIHESVSKQERRILYVNGAAVIDKKIYLTTDQMNGLFALERTALQDEMVFEAILSKVPKWRFTYGYMVRSNDKLYLTPVYAKDAIEFNPFSNSIKSLGARGREFDIRFWGLDCVEDSLYFQPDMKYMIMEYSVKKGIWNYHMDSVESLWEGIGRDPSAPILNGRAVWEKSVYYSTGEGNRILKLTSGDVLGHILTVGTPEMRIVLRGASQEGLWFTDRNKEEEILMAPWNQLETPNKWKRYHMPEDYVYTSGIFNRSGIYGDMYEVDDYMIIFPYKAAKMVRLHKQTGEVEYIAEGFWRDSDKKGIDYNIEYWTVCNIVISLEYPKFLVQRMRDKHMAIIDVIQDTYEEFVPRISEEDFKRLVLDDPYAGFDKGDERDAFYMQESRMFPVENFLDNFAKDGYAGLKEKQLKALSSLAANLDGTCGEKTHAFIMKELEKEDEY